MAQYIDKSALVAEIERRLEAIAKASTKNNRELAAIQGAQQYELITLIQILNTLEVKEMDDELQGIEKEVAEGFVERINKKRIPISLKGEKKAKFKNEFNTLWQIIDGIQFANVAKHIIERLCLHFAAWGAYNLKGIGQINKNDNKMDVEVKEVDLEKEYKEFIQCTDGRSMFETAKHFFELGLKVQKENKL